MTLAHRIDRHIAASAAMAGLAILGPAVPQADAAVIGTASLSYTIPSGVSVVFDLDPIAGTYTIYYYTGSLGGAHAAYPGTEFGIYFYGPAIITALGVSDNSTNTATTTTFFAGYLGVASYYYPYVIPGGKTLTTTYKAGTYTYGWLHFYFITPPDKGYWSGSSGYVGFYFTSGGSTYLGWLGIDYSTYGTPILTGIAFNTTALASVTTGVVPEPGASTLAALALGAAGLAGWRRRRREEEQEEAA